LAYSPFGALRPNQLDRIVSNLREARLAAPLMETAAYRDCRVSQRAQADLQSIRVFNRVMQ
jgi:hypothetical protein